MIQLKYVKDEIFVYNLKDWKTLRQEYRIVGQIIGSSTSIPSLPVKLLPEEAALLLENNLAKIYESCSSSANNAESRKVFEDTLLKVQQKEYREIRKLQLESLIDKIIEKRRNLGDDRSKEDIFTEELDKSSQISWDNMVWPILLEDNCSEFTLVSQDAISSLTTPLKLSIFKDLWTRGYYITNGEKFGGDFLVYFGDPIAYHAIFIVKCVEQGEEFSPAHLIALGRLGVAVKKKAVLGSLEGDKVSYITINWIDA